MSKSDKKKQMNPAPKPWTTQEDHNEELSLDFYWIYDANEQAIANTKLNCFISLEEAKATARLMAKAPEMKDLIGRYLTFLNSDYDGDRESLHEVASEMNVLYNFLEGKEENG